MVPDRPRGLCGGGALSEVDAGMDHGTQRRRAGERWRRWDGPSHGVFSTGYRS